jgi:hypothetical protein
MREILYAIAIVGVGAGAVLSTRAESVRIEPGQWTFEARVGRMSASGLPPGISQAQLREAVFGNTLRAAGPACLTAAQAARFDDRNSFRVEGYGRNHCRTTVWERSGETIRIAGSCDDRRGGLRDFRITGTAGPRNIDLLIHYVDRTSRHPGRVESELRFTGHRTGPCSGNAFAPRPDLQGGAPRTGPSASMSTGGGTGVEASNMAATDAAAAH